MVTPGRGYFSIFAGVLVAAAFTARLLGADAALGIFSDRSDIGPVSRPTTAGYDAATKTYTVGASGANMWAGEDAFGFVWRQVTGDFAIAAEIELMGSSPQKNRKACLMIRQSLDAGSAYVDVAVHGDGHTSLQFRREGGGPTRTIQGSATAPRGVRLEKRGDSFTLSLADADGEYSTSGCAVRVAFEGPVYVGLAVCAHDNAGFETARFAAVELGEPPPRPAARGTALEAMAIASLDRRVVHRAEGKMEAPHFSPDGGALYFNRDGRLHRLKMGAGESPVVIDTGFATRCINDHGISPDGTRLVISDLTETGRSLMYLLPIGGGTPERIEVDGPAYWHGWSPDGRTLAYCAARDGNYDIYTIPVSGGRETRLTTAPGNDNGPDYSPDGKWIYYHSMRDGGVQVWRMHPDGTKQEQVTNDDYYNWFPHPSPDGRWIAILSTKVAPDTGHPPDGEYVLRLIATDGSAAPREAARFHGGNGCFNVPCWSRDSAQIAYAVYEPAQ